MTQVTSPSSPSSTRFLNWVAFFLFSTITFGAAIESQAHTDRYSPAARTNQNYAVACSALLFFLSTTVVTLHTRPLFASLILGTKIEGILIFSLLSFGSALVAIVSDTRHGLATDSTGSISNGNLYYFSWASLLTGVSLMYSFLRSNYGIDVTEELRSRAQRLPLWVCLGTLGLIQMGSSARLYDNHCGANTGLDLGERGTVAFCRKCQLGIALGIICVVVSMIIVVWKFGMASGSRLLLSTLFTIEMVMSGMMMGAQGVGVAFLTGQGGPGAPLNNLYYSTWGTLLTSLVLGGKCVEDYSTAKKVMRDSNQLGEEGLELR